MFAVGVAHWAARVSLRPPLAALKVNYPVGAREGAGPWAPFCPAERNPPLRYNPYGKIMVVKYPEDSGFSFREENTRSPGRPQFSTIPARSSQSLRSSSSKSRG